MTVDSLLEVQVLLQQLVPLSLALPFSLLELVDDAPILYIFLGQVFQELRKDRSLLLRVAG